MITSKIIKWVAAVLIVPAIPVLAATVTSPKPTATRTAAVKPATSADSQKLAAAIAALSKPTHTTAGTATKAAVKPAAKSAVTSTAARTHVVASGETFSSISQKVYGSAKYWSHIADANPKVQAKSLRPGMVLTIPAFTPPAKTATAAKPKTATPTSAIKPRATGSLATHP